MTLARRRALIMLLVAGIAAAAIGVLLLRHSRRPSTEPKPTLLLLTSLPLVFNENFSLQGGGSAALRALEKNYRVRPISVADPAELARGRLLLAAHPLAQPAEDLVALDDWVRRGGRLMLLADPMLQWPSKRPLGDPVRPPPMFMDTGLLAHWNLRLEPPEARGPALRKLGGRDVVTVSPGSLHGCKSTSDGLVAHCTIGRGEVTVIADADFLDTDPLGPAASGNLDGLLAALAELRR